MVSVTQTITLTAVPTLTENTTLGGELTWDKLNKFLVNQENEWFFRQDNFEIRVGRLHHF